MRCDAMRCETRNATGKLPQEGVDDVLVILISASDYRERMELRETKG